MQYDMLFHTTSKKKYDGQDFKVETLSNTWPYKKTFIMTGRDKHKQIR